MLIKRKHTKTTENYLYRTGHNGVLLMRYKFLLGVNIMDPFRFDEYQIAVVVEGAVKVLIPGVISDDVFHLITHVIRHLSPIGIYVSIIIAIIIKKSNNSKTKIMTDHFVGIQYCERFQFCKVLYRFFHRSICPNSHIKCQGQSTW